MTILLDWVIPLGGGVLAILLCTAVVRFVNRDVYPEWWAFWRFFD